MADDGLTTLRATAALPLAGQFGTQLDAVGGFADGEALWGGGLHVFWRDPEAGLIGVFASQTEWDSIAARRVGARGHLYVNRFTLRGSVSQQFGDVEEGVVGDVDLRWYVTDDFATTAGADYVTGDWLTRLNAEYRPGWAAVPDLSFFADGALGEDGYHLVLVGISWSFGDSGTLMQRDRSGIPFDTFSDQLFPIQRERDRRAQVSPPAAPPQEPQPEDAGPEPPPPESPAPESPPPESPSTEPPEF